MDTDLKTIHHTFPVIYDEERGVLFVSSSGSEAETECLLSKLHARQHILWPHRHCGGLSSVHKKDIH